MDFLEDLSLINRISFKKTFLGLKNNWPLVFVGFLYWILSFFAILLSGFLFRGPFSILRGIFTTLFISSLISNYLVMIQLTVLNRKMTLDNFKEGFKYYVWKIYGIFFIMYMVTYLLQILGMGLRTNLTMLLNLVYLSFFILFNALPEAIYLKNYIPMDTIRYSLEFMKENWIQWLLPNILISLIFYLIFGSLNNFIRSGLGSLDGAFVIEGLLRALIGQVFLGLFMIYRGNLFYILSNSTRRNRAYKYGRD